MKRPTRLSQLSLYQLWEKRHSSMFADAAKVKAFRAENVRIADVRDARRAEDERRNAEERV